MGINILLNQLLISNVYLDKKYNANDNKMCLCAPGGAIFRLSCFMMSNALASARVT